MTAILDRQTRTGGDARLFAERSQVPAASSYINHRSLADPFLDIVLRRFDLEFTSAVLTPDADERVGMSSGPASAVAVVHDLMTTLGLSQKDVLKAAGIRKRTFQDWQKNPERQPRLSSQADLWALAQSVEVIAEHVENCERWLKSDSERVRKLCRGEHRDLVQIAARVRTEDHAAQAVERLSAVGFFDYGEPPEGPSRRPGVGPVRVAAAPRAARRTEITDDGK